MGSSDEYQTDDYYASAHESDEEFYNCKPGTVVKVIVKNGTVGGKGGKDKAKCRGGMNKGEKDGSSSAASGGAKCSSPSNGNDKANGGEEEKRASCDNSGSDDSSDEDAMRKKIPATTGRAAKCETNKQSIDSDSGDSDDVYSTNNEKKNARKSPPNNNKESPQSNNDSHSGDSDDPFSHLSRFNKSKRQKLMELSDDDDSDDDYSDDSFVRTKKPPSSSKTAAASSAKGKKKTVLDSSSEVDSDDEYFAGGTAKGKAKGASVKKAAATTTKKTYNLSDSDSDIELLGTSSRKNPVRKSLSHSKADVQLGSEMKKQEKGSAAERSSAKSGGDSVTCLLSSSDEAASPRRRSPRKQPPPQQSTASSSSVASKTTEQHNPTVRADSNKTLEQVRAAREALRQAQRYQAEDVEVELPSPVRTARAMSSNVEVVDIDAGADVGGMRMFGSQRMGGAMGVAAASNTSEVTYNGATIHLTLRYKDVTTCKDKNAIVRIKTDEPLNSLSSKLQAQTGYSITTMNFDGQKLDTTKTPSFYEMEDEDLVDVAVARGGGKGGRTQSPSKIPSISDMLTIHVRRSGASSQHTFRLGKKDQLSKMVSAYCREHHLTTITLQHNGRRLDPTKSPQAEGLVSGVCLDAVVVGAFLAAATSVGGRAIQLKFRVNGIAKDVHTITVPLKGQLQPAMAAFAKNRRCALADCKFIFDGEVLPGTATPESLDLEGGEIIDVKLAVNTAPQRDTDGDVVMDGTLNSTLLSAGVALGSTLASAVSALGSPIIAAAPATISIKTNRNVSL